MNLLGCSIIHSRTLEAEKGRVSRCEKFREILKKRNQKKGESGRNSQRELSRESEAA